MYRHTWPFDKPRKKIHHCHCCASQHHSWRFIIWFHNVLSWILEPKGFAFNSNIIKWVLNCSRLNMRIYRKMEMPQISWAKAPQLLQRERFLQNLLLHVEAINHKSPIIYLRRRSSNSNCHFWLSCFSTGVVSRQLDTNAGSGPLKRNAFNLWFFSFYRSRQQ